MSSDLISQDEPGGGGGVLRLAELTWPEVEALNRERTIPILAVGAVEAHGPHLPLLTDGIIALGMAESGARRLAEHGLTPLLLPPLDYTAAPFAAGFPGTLSVRPETLTALAVDIGRALASHGFVRLAVANAHLDPTHVGSLYAASEALGERPQVVFPDITRKPWALRLTDEFKSGACHAGRYESSIVLARRPELVREARRRGLAANPISLSRAIRDGRRTFEESGGPEAYFGDPAAATTSEGETTLETLGEILAEAVLAAFEDAGS